MAQDEGVEEALIWRGLPFVPLARIGPIWSLRANALFAQEALSPSAVLTAAESSAPGPRAFQTLARDADQGVELRIVIAEFGTHEQQRHIDAGLGVA